MHSMVASFLSSSPSATPISGALAPEIGRTLTTAGSVCWTWWHPRDGALHTCISSDGRVSEWRQHPKDAQPSFNAIGTASAAAMAGLQSRMAAFLASSAAENTASSEQEHWRLDWVAADGTTQHRHISAAADRATPADPAAQACRQAVQAVRNSAEGGRWRWRSLVGRLLWLCLSLSLLWLYWWGQDMRQSATWAKEGQQLTATVVQRDGRNGNDPHKSITVAFTPGGQAPQTITITDYLSADNWEAATPHSTLLIRHHPKAGTVVEADWQRFERSKYWFLLFPAVLLGVSLLVLLLWPRLRIGQHQDGQEYIVDGDRVISDDKDMPVSRTTLNIGRLLWRVLT